MYQYELCGVPAIFLKSAGSVKLWSSSHDFQARLEKGKFADIFARGTISMSELSLFFEGSTAVQKKLTHKNRGEKYDSYGYLLVK